MMNQWKKGRGTQFFLQYHVIWTGFTKILWHGNDEDSWTGDIGDVSSEGFAYGHGKSNGKHLPRTYWNLDVPCLYLKWPMLALFFSSYSSCRSTGQTHISNHFNMFHNDLTSCDIVSFRSSSWKKRSVAASTGVSANPLSNLRGAHVQRVPMIPIALDRFSVPACWDLSSATHMYCKTNQ